jgi:FKBP-type peptidyl-prolyl cis-trans isomerase
MKSTLFSTILLFASVLLLAAGCQGGENLGGDPEYRTNLDSVSYSLGYFYGSSMADEGIDEFNYRNFIAGFRKAMEGQESDLDQMEMQLALQTFQTELQQRLDADRETSAAANIEEGNRFLAENAERDDVVVTDSGLQYRVIEEGDGVSPSGDSQVRVHYRGTLISGEEFDSSHERGQPAEFPLDRGRASVRPATKFRRNVFLSLPQRRRRQVYGRERRSGHSNAQSVHRRADGQIAGCDLRRFRAKRIP